MWRKNLPDPLGVLRVYLICDRLFCVTEDPDRRLAFWLPDPWYSGTGALKRLESEIDGPVLPFDDEDLNGFYWCVHRPAGPDRRGEAASISELARSLHAEGVRMPLVHASASDERGNSEYRFLLGPGITKSGVLEVGRGYVIDRTAHVSERHLSLRELNELNCALVAVRPS